MSGLAIVEIRGFMLPIFNGKQLDLTMARNLAGFFNGDDFQKEREKLAGKLQEIIEEGE